VISFGIGIGFVALYQAGYKAAEMFGLFSVQMQDALSPAAARMNISRDKSGLRDLLITSTQLTLLLTTPLYALCAAYMEPIIKILTGLKIVSPPTFWVGQSLLLATFSSLITSSCSKRILMMCGWERKLLKISIIDATINLVASIILVRRYGVLGVALGTMVPTVLLGWLWVVPLTARFLKVGVLEMIKSIAMKVTLPVFASLFSLGVLVRFVPAPPEVGFGAYIWRGAIVMAVLGVTGLPFLKQIRSKS